MNFMNERARSSAVVYPSSLSHAGLIVLSRPSKSAAANRSFESSKTRLRSRVVSWTSAASLSALPRSASSTRCCAVTSTLMPVSRTGRPAASRTPVACDRTQRTSPSRRCTRKSSEKPSPDRAPSSATVTARSRSSGWILPAQASKSCSRGRSASMSRSAYISADQMSTFVVSIQSQTPRAAAV